jgi:hypothetical protein
LKGLNSIEYLVDLPDNFLMNLTLTLFEVSTAQKPCNNLRRFLSVIVTLRVFILTFHPMMSISVPKEHFFSFIAVEPNKSLQNFIEFSISDFICVEHPAPAVSSA